MFDSSYYLVNEKVPFKKNTKLIKKIYIYLYINIITTRLQFDSFCLKTVWYSSCDWHLVRMYGGHHARSQLLMPLDLECEQHGCVRIVRATQVCGAQSSLSTGYTRAMEALRLILSFLKEQDLLRCRARESWNNVIVVLGETLNIKSSRCGLRLGINRLHTLLHIVLLCMSTHILIRVGLAGCKKRITMIILIKLNHLIDLFGHFFSWRTKR